MAAGCGDGVGDFERLPRRAPGKEGLGRAIHGVKRAVTDGDTRLACPRAGGNGIRCPRGQNQTIGPVDVADHGLGWVLYRKQRVIDVCAKTHKILRFGVVGFL